MKLRHLTLLMLLFLISPVASTLARSGVPDNWMDIVPLYLHRGNATARIGFVNALQPNTPFEMVLPLKPEKLSINDNEDVLAEVKQ